MSSPRPRAPSRDDPAARSRRGRPGRQRWGWIAGVALGGTLAAGPATAFDSEMGTTEITVEPSVRDGRLAANVTCRFTSTAPGTSSVVWRRERSISIRDVTNGADRLIGQWLITPDQTRAPWRQGGVLSLSEHDDQAYDDPDTTSRTYRCEVRWNEPGEQSGTITHSNVTYDDDEYESVTTDEDAVTGLPPPPRTASGYSQFADRDRVVIDWGAVSHTGTGALPVEGYSVGRDTGEGWVVIGTVDADTTTFHDTEPLPGTVKYAVRTESFASRDHADYAPGERRYGAFGTIVSIWSRAENMDTLGAPRSVALTTVGGGREPTGYHLSWDPPANTRRYDVRAYEVRTQAGNAEPVAQPLLSGTSFTLSSPTPGERYSFWVSAVRASGGVVTERAAQSDELRIGTEAAPLVREADTGTGWVRVVWDPGPLNGNGAPRDRIDWYLRWREQGSEEWTAIADFGGPDSREATVALRGRFLGTSATARRYEIEVAAENTTGLGAFGRLLTRDITPATSGMEADSPVFNHGGTGITWHLEGPTEVRLGETATWTVRARRNDGSDTPITELMGRPVGVRENQDATRALVELDRTGLNCDNANVPSASTDKDYMLCLHLADALPGWSDGRLQFRQAQSGDPAFIAYYPYIDRSASPWTGGVPAGHEMKVTIRDDVRFIGETFDAVIGVRSGGVEFGDLSLRNQSRALTATVVYAVPQPPTNVRLSVTQEGDREVYRITWDPPPNAKSAGVVDDDDYEVYGDLNNQNAFSNPAGVPITDRTYERRGSQGATYAFYVVAVNPDGEASPPSTIVRGGLPAPPANVQAEALGSAVRLTWDASPSSFTTAYRVQYSRDEGSSWTTVERGSTETTYTHTGLSNPEGLWYRVIPWTRTQHATFDGRSGNIAVAIAQSDQVPAITITRQSAASMGEGGSAEFVLQADPTPRDDLAVTVRITGGAAVGVTGSSQTTRTVNFEPGDATATLTVETVNDNIEEPDSTLTATVQAIGFYTVGDPGFANVTVLDDDILVTITTGVSEVVEGQSFTMTFTVNEPVLSATTIWTTLNGASGFQIEEAGSHILSLPADRSSVESPLAIPNDVIDRSDATLTVIVVGVQGYGGNQIQPSSLELPIRDDDILVTMTPPAQPVVEGQPVEIGLSIREAESADLTVTVNTRGGSDFGIADTGHEAILPANETSTVLRIETDNDVSDERDRILTATIGGVSGYSANQIQNPAASVEVSLRDNDRIAWVNMAFLYLEDGGATQIPVALEYAADTQITVNVRLSGGSDYGIEDGTRAVVFPVGETEMNLPLGIDDDTIDDPDATLTVTFLDGDGYVWDRTSGGSSPLRDQDIEVSISAASGVPVEEGSPAVFMVSMSSGRWWIGGALDVEVAVTTQGGDFGIGARTHTVSVPTSLTEALSLDTDDDSLAEPVGSVTATVLDRDGYTPSVSSSSATLTLRDNDDIEVSIRTASLTVREGDVIMFIVEANSRLPGVPLTVNLQVEANHGLPDGGDFGLPSETTQLPFTSTGASFTKGYLAVDDDIEEPSGNLKATVLPGTGYVPGATSSVTVTIHNDDITVSVSSENASVLEGEGAAFQVSTVYPLVEQLSVNYTITTTGEFGITPHAGAITILAGGRIGLSHFHSDQDPRALSTVDDYRREANGSVTMRLLAGPGYVLSGTRASDTVEILDNGERDPDVNSDHQVNSNDALILYYAYSLRGLLGTGR